MKASTTRDALSRLATAKEDVFNVHKILGVACLLSFLTRFSKIGHRDMGFDSSISTPLTILLHFLLSISSLLFEIPQKRMKGSGFRIWPEYRYHSIAFACRSLTCMMLTYTWATRGIEGGVLTHAANTIVVLLSCLAADLGSHAVDETNRSNTIRDLNASPATRFHFSVMQFYATAGCLFGFERYSIHFVMVFIIQFNAFLMTLQRKNIGSHYAMVGAYGSMLAVGFVVGALEVNRASAFWLLSAVSNIAAVNRIGLGLNKYVLWIVTGVLLHFLRPTIESPAWPVVYAVSMVALGIVGYKKVVLEGQSSDKSSTKIRKRE